jgi:hypothetical protein
LTTLHRALRQRARFLATAAILAIGIASAGTPVLADGGAGRAGCGGAAGSAGGTGFAASAHIAPSRLGA